MPLSLAFLERFDEDHTGCAVCLEVAPMEMVPRESAVCRANLRHR